MKSEKQKDDEKETRFGIRLYLTNQRLILVDAEPDRWRPPPPPACTQPHARSPPAHRAAAVEGWEPEIHRVETESG